MTTKRLSGTPKGRRYEVTGRCDTPGCKGWAVARFKGEKCCAKCLNPSEPEEIQIPTMRSALGLVNNY